MTGPKHSFESTPEPHTGPSRPPAPASTEGDERTPEGRLLARKGSAQYRADVEALIARAENAERELQQARDAAGDEYARAERAEGLVDEATAVLAEHRHALEERDRMIEDLASNARAGGTLWPKGVSPPRRFGSIFTRRHDESDDDDG